MSGRFVGKSIVVTGAAAGMGRQITLDFLKEGAYVVAVDKNEEGLRQLKEESKGTLYCFHGDVSEEDTNIGMIDLAVRQYGRLDVLVNNAGIAGHSEAITDTTNEDWNKILAVDLYGPMYAIRKAVSVMREKKQGGSIVTIASVAGLKGCRSCLAYTAAKHGLIGVCEHTAYMYMHEGIRSNIVCPGAIRTSMYLSDVPENEFGIERIRSGMDSRFPVGAPDDIASAVLFLASEDAKFINGAKLVVDGGISCN